VPRLVTTALLWTTEKTNPIQPIMPAVIEPSQPTEKMLWNINFSYVGSAWCVLTT
jgi:hypothetical protein